MTDWNKLKVVDLKAELKRRGLAQTGLKPALVARLASAENEDGEDSETTVQGDGAKQDGSSAASPDTVSPILPTSELSSELLQDAPTQETSPTYEMSTSMDEPSQHPSAAPTITGQQDSELQSDSVPAIPPVELPAKPSITIEPPTQIPETHQSALPSVEPQEARDDGQKRKRRSQSPPPAGSESARKRARQDESMAGVEDGSLDSAEPQLQHKNKLDSEDRPDGDAMVTDADSEFVQEISKDRSPIASRIDLPVADEMLIDTEERMKRGSEPINDSPSRPRSSKYKELFAPHQRRPSFDNSALRDVPDMMDTEPDRVIAPAIHPATSSLYIRDFMRPINENQLKAYLAELATAPGQDLDLNVITKFYVDAIRTHAFISFTSVSAASRVRSAIHDRKWPEETNRKPLWADFVPADKVEIWIQEELSGQGGGRAASKRWEVKYDVDDERNVTASLQESANLTRPPVPVRQPSLSVPTPNVPLQHKGIEGAPLGPRSDQIKAARAATNFSTLDQLFKCTSAKPALYWLPVSKEVADKRLDNIDSATSKTAQGQRVPGAINRYTFEDHDVLVDRGPEIFPGIRPPPGHPSSRGGGYRGGGRGGNREGRGPPRASDRYDGYHGGDRRDRRDDRRY
jgi:hypothetical protein